MKRALCVIMCCVIVAALSLSVFAVEVDGLPDNDVIGTFIFKSINFRYYDVFTDETNNLLLTINDVFSFGELYHLNIQAVADDIGSSYPIRLFSNFSFDVILNDNATIYYPVSNKGSLTYNFRELEQYRYSSGDISINYDPPSYSYAFRLDTSSGNQTDVVFSKYETDSSFVDTINFLCFRDVPKGVYSITIQNEVNEIEWIQSHQQLVVAPFVSIPTLFDDVASGYIPSHEAYNSILANLDSVINSNLSLDEKQLALAVAQLDLQQIFDAETSLIGSTVLPLIFDMVNQIIFSFTSAKNVDELSFFYYEGLTQLNTIYVQSLGSLLTSSNGNLFTEEYNTILSFLDKVYNFSKFVFETTIVTDSDLKEDEDKLTDLDSKYEVEEDLLNQFDQETFDDSINYSDWLSSLRSDYLEYKSIYNWFFDVTKSGSIANFLIMPFFLVITSILLGTAMGVKKN